MTIFKPISTFTAALILSTGLCFSAGIDDVAPAATAPKLSQQQILQALERQDALIQQLQADAAAKQAKIAQTKADMQAALDAQERKENCCTNCIAWYRKNQDVIAGMTTLASRLTQMGLRTAGQIKGDPKLIEAADIVDKSTTSLTKLMEQLAQARQMSDILRASVQATADGLNIASDATGDATVQAIADMMPTAAEILNVDLPQ